MLGRAGSVRPVDDLAIFESVAAAIEGKFSGRVATGNTAAAKAAFDLLSNQAQGAIAEC